MTEDWRTFRIEELSDGPRGMAMGPFGSNIKSEFFVRAGVPVIRGKNLGNGSFHDDGFVYISEEHAEKLATSEARPGDLVFTHRGTIGQVARIPEKSRYPRYIASQSQMRARFSPDKADSRYMHYWFQSPLGQFELLSNATQTGVPAIARPLSHLKSITLQLPDLCEQRRIAGVLGALDDLIDTNEQLSGRLQRSMSAHYSRVSQQATHVGPIGEFVKTAARGVTPKYSDGDGAVLVLNQKCIRNGLVNLNSARLMQPRPAKPEKFVQPGDAVVNSTGVGTLGRAARWVGAEPIFVDSHVTVVKPADSEESGWVARALVESLADIEALAQGSTGQTELSRDQLLSLSVAVPPKSIRVQASRLFDELDASIEVLATENQQLRQTRDELLPLLMSGKIRVREAEELVKERVG